MDICIKSGVVCFNEDLFPNFAISSKPVSFLGFSSKPAPLCPRLSLNPPSAAKQNLPSPVKRCDSATLPLQPQGVFRGVKLSLAGFNGSPLELTLKYQITSNGGSVVDMSSKGLLAVICPDGNKPSVCTVQCLSPRWINACLSMGALLDGNGQIFYFPSDGHLPLLMMNGVCLYVSERDSDKLNEIIELSKICGIKCLFRNIENNKKKIPLSIVSHFIFNDLASLNRRRDLLALARRADKHVVSAQWLRDSYKSGTKQNEAEYALDLDMPSLPPPQRHHTLTSFPQLSSNCPVASALVPEQSPIDWNESKLLEYDY